MSGSIRTVVGRSSLVVGQKPFAADIIEKIFLVLVIRVNFSAFSACSAVKCFSGLLMAEVPQGVK
jgi:hypothetical protein